MSCRFDTATDKLRVSSGLPSTTAFTVAFWAYIAVDRNSFTPFFYRTNNPGNPYIYLGTTVDGTTLQLDGQGVGQGSSTAATGTNLTAATWYHIALTLSGGTALVVYLNGVSNATQTMSPSFTGASGAGGDALTFGHDSDTDNDFLNGRLAAIKVWDGVALTAAEVLQEMIQYLPTRLPNLYGFYPLLNVAGDFTVDYGGGGHALTASGTLVAEDGPPIPWGRGARRRAVTVATGGGGGGSAGGGSTGTGMPRPVAAGWV